MPSGGRIVEDGIGGVGYLIASVAVVAAVSFTAMGYALGNSAGQAKEQQMMGRPAKDLCLERSGVTYCAIVDGISLKDFVDNYYRMIKVRGE